MSISAEQATQAMDQSRLIYSAEQVENALDQMAAAITSDTATENPIMLSVMNGGLIPLGMLLPRLSFPLRIDYLHATRYREKTFGTDLQWKKHPELPLQDETVVVVDDILDEGYTLEAIVEHCQEAGAKKVLSAVLVEKDHQRGTPFKADYVGLKAPDLYLFGYGMDYKGYWRNAAGIYAISESE
jgi:hypoxanthine phosphoribosyltransferase